VLLVVGLRVVVGFGGLVDLVVLLVLVDLVEVLVVV
jgi:hypothetical protein